MALPHSNVSQPGETLLLHDDTYQCNLGVVDAFDEDHLSYHVYRHEGNGKKGDNNFALLLMRTLDLSTFQMVQ
jgi:hypothetical protein